MCCLASIDPQRHEPITRWSDSLVTCPELEVQTLKQQQDMRLYCIHLSIIQLKYPQIDGLVIISIGLGWFSFHSHSDKKTPISHYITKHARGTADIHLAPPTKGTQQKVKLAESSKRDKDDETVKGHVRNKGRHYFCPNSTVVLSSVPFFQVVDTYETARDARRIRNR